MGVPVLRMVSCNVRGLRIDVGALAEQLGPLAPDVVVVREGPRRLRWRTRGADLANRMRLVHAAGGEPSLGNLILTSLRVAVEEWAVQYPLTPGRRMRGAVLARCAVAGGTFTLAGTQFAADERLAQATVLRRSLSEVDGPLIVVADLAEDPGGPAGRVLAEGMTAVAVPDAMILVSGGVTVTGHRVLDDVAGTRPPVLVDLSLPGTTPDDQGEMVSEAASH